MSAPDASAPYDRSDRALDTLRLLYLSEILDALMAYAEGRPRPLGLRSVPDWVLESDLREDARQDAMRQWRSVFSDELATVKAARNSVAHALKVDDQLLREAVRVARQLVINARVLLGYTSFTEPLSEPDAP